jgi:TonB family protein
VRAVVRLRATFHESGVITEVVVSQPSGCEYLDTEAVKVAKQIKFEPAIKNGQPATVVITLEYSAGVGS